MTADWSLHLAGAKVRLRCGFTPLLEYARAHFAPAEDAAADDTPPAIDAEIHWHEAHPPRDAAAAYPEVRGAERLDRDLYRNGQQLVWLRIDELRDLHLRFDWNGQTLRVRGDYYHRLSTNAGGDRLRRLVYHNRMDALRRKRFTRLLYFGVYYPLFWWLERMRDTHPLHAGAVHTPRGALLLAGPSGVGKSTLTAALGSGDGAAILSDTFTLHRGTEMWAVPEPMLLDRWSRDWLGEAAKELVGVEHGYALGRDGYSVPAARFRARAEAAAIVLPHRAQRDSDTRLDPAAAVSRIEAYNDIVNDMRRYRPVAAVLELLDPTGLGRARVRNLEELTAAVPCWEIGLSPSLTRDQAVTRLLAILDGSEQQRAASHARH